MPYCIADGFAQYLLAKVSSKGGGAYQSINLTADNYGSHSPTASTTYTFTQAYSKVTIPTHYYVNGGGGQASHSVQVSIKRGNTTVWSKSETAPYLTAVDKREMVELTDIANGEVLTFSVTVGGRYGETSQNAYGGFEATINAQQAGDIERNLIPTEVKPL